MSDSGQFPPQNSPDWLPAGWTVEVRSNNGKNVKSYVDQLTGYRFYSKPKVLEYLGTRNSSWTSQVETAGNDYDINLPVNLNQTPGLSPHRSIPETTPLENFSQYGKINEPVVLEPLYSGEVAEKSPDWLPPGWTEEVKVRDGRMIKAYIDPLWGHRFYTKPQVLQYLGVVTNDSSTSQKETSGNTSESNLIEKASVTPEPLSHVSTFTTPWENGSQSKRHDVPSELKFPELQASEMSYSGRMVTEKPPDWLPSGWTVEVSVRNGRSLKSYVDQLTGRKFYSKPKVLEYLGTAMNGGGTSERKKMGNDFDINLPVNINDPLEPLPHGQFMGLETQENVSRSGKSSELDVGKTEEVTPAPQLVQSQNMNTLDNTMHPKETNSRKRAGRKVCFNTDVDKIEGVNSTPKLVECQNMNTLDNTNHPKETSSRKRAGRKVYFSPDMNKTEDVTSIPQLVESQIMNTLDNIHLKETSSRKRPGRKANTVQSQIMNTLDNIHLKETSSRKRPGRKANVVKTGEETLPPQLVECQNGESLDHSVYTSTSKDTSSRKKPGKRPTVDKTEGETHSPRLVESPSVITPSFEASSSKQPEGKIGMEQLPKGLPPGWITEIKTKRIRSNKFKKISYYVDPVSGFVFSSQKDAWRYYETGDVSKCVIKPKNREEMGFTTKNSSLNVDKDGSTVPLQLLEQPKHDNTRKGTRFSLEDEKLRSSKQYDGEVLIERVTAEGLPSGWIKEVKTEKFYTDPGSGYVFMSQKDALLFLETGDIGACAVKPKSREELGLNEASTPMTSKVRGGPPVQHLEQSQIDNTPRLTRASRQNQVSSSKKTGGKIAVEGVTSDGTPRVTVEENSIQKATGINKTRGESNMQQIEKSQALNTPKMGKTRGKSALQHLEQSSAISTSDHASLSSPQKEVTSSMLSGKKFVLEKVAPTGLPPGWIKEIRIQKKAVGIRKDQFFTDPISGYVFCSLKDVYRFVETGGIHSCVMKPKKREDYGFDQLSDIASPAVVQKPERDSTKKQLSSSKVGSKRSLDTTDSDVSQKRRQTRSSIASPAVVQSPEPDATKQLTSSRVNSKKGLATIGSDVSQKRQTRSAIASPAVVQTPEPNATNKQLTTGSVNSEKGLATIGSDVSQKRQTRSAISSAAVGPDLERDTTKQLSSGKKIGSKRSLETVHSDVSQKRRQTRSAASPAVLQKLERDSTEKQLSIGKKVSSKRNLETTDSNVSQKRRQTRSSASAVTTDTPTAELPKEAPKLDIVFEKPTRAKKGNTSNQSPLPKTKVSKREKGSICSPPKTVISKVKNVRSPPSTVNVKVKNVKVKSVRSPPSTKNFKVKNVEKKGTEKNSNKKADSPASRSKKKETKEKIRTPPSRTSKRTTGINIETVPNAGPTDKALTSKVKKSGKNKDISLNAPNILPSGEQPPTAEVQSSKEDNATQMNVEYSEQTLTSEGENSGKTENVTCPNAPDDVADNTPQQLETVPELRDTELEKSCQNKEISCPNTSVVDVVHDAPKEFETGSVMGKTDHDLGGTDAPANAEVSNKSNEATENLATEQIVSQERLGEVSNKSNEAVGDQVVLQQKLTDVSSKRNEAAEEQVEEQTVSQENPVEVSNKSSEAAEDQVEEQTVSQENPVEVSNKSSKAAEDQVEEQTVSQENPVEVSNKSNEDAKRAQDQTVSYEQSTEVSNKGVSIEDKAEDQMESQELSAEVSNIYVFEDQTIPHEPPTVSNQSWEVVEEEAEDQAVSQEVPNQQECIDDQTISQEPLTEVSKTEAMEEKVEEQTMSQDQPMYQFGEESWSDPCLDFAFKTLTGTLPFEDNVQEPNMFQAQGDNSQAKIADNGLAMLDFGATSAHQVSNSHAQNASETFHQMDNSDTQPESETQYPNNPMYLPDMNSSFPSGSETGPQQTDFEENKNDDKDELTLDNYARFLF